MHRDHETPSTRHEVEPRQKQVAPFPQVVIVGAGFGGLQAARDLGKVPVQMTVIDRNNHHLFQPLLYQMAIVVSFRERSFLRTWWVLLLEGLVGLIFGILAFAWPGETALVLLFLVAIWALVTGVMEIGSAFVVPGSAGQRWGLVLAGLLSIIFGIILIVHPGAGLLVVLWLVGIYAIVFGMSLIIYAFQIRSRASAL